MYVAGKKNNRQIFDFYSHTVDLQMVKANRRKLNQI